MPQRNSGRDLAGRSANQRAQARQHFFDLERLGHVVVGAAVDALHLLVPAAARGQHQHRRGDARFAPVPQHRQAIHLRQTQVEHHRVVSLGSSQKLRLLAVAGHVDGVPGLAQHAAKLFSQNDFVFDDEDAHRLLTVTSSPLNFS